MQMEKGTSAAEVLTPEVLRAASRSSHEAPTKPGERSPSRSSSSAAKSPSKMGGRLRRCGHTLSFVPLWALLSLGLLVAGLTLTAIKGPAAADAADGLLALLSSSTGSGFPKYMQVYSTSVWVTVGVAGAGVAALILGASLRLDQRLRKAGKYNKPKGPYGPLLFRFYCFLDWVGLILVTLLALWAAVVGVMLASWAAQCWNLEQGAKVASMDLAALSGMSERYRQSLDEFAAVIMATATGTTIVQLTATDSKERSGMPDVDGSAPAPAAAPLAASPASSPAPVEQQASAPAPASGQVSATELDSPKPTTTQVPAVSVPNTAPASAPTPPSTAAPLPAGSLAQRINTTIASMLPTLTSYAANFSEVDTRAAVLQENGRCPSAACLNMAMYPFTKSAACICTQVGMTATTQLAESCKETAVWVLVGMAGLFVGATFAAMELSADALMLAADQVFLRVIKRKASRSSSKGTARKIEEGSMTRREMLSPALPSRGSYPYLTVNANGAT